MKKIIISAIALIMIAFASCSKSGVDNATADTQSGGDVSFSAAISSRVEASAFQINDRVSISSYSNKVLADECITYGWNGSEFLSNTPITKESDVELSYIGVYPVQSSNSFTHIIMADQSNDDDHELCDLLVAQKAATSSSSITLDFKHMMCQMNIIFSVTDNRTEGNGYGESLLIEDLRLNFSTGEWVECDLANDSFVTGGDSISIIPNGSNYNYTVIFAPQILAEGEYILTAKLDDEDVKWASTLSYNFEAGDSYTCTWKIVLSDYHDEYNDITISPAVINDWEADYSITEETLDPVAGYVQYKRHRGECAYSYAEVPITEDKTGEIRYLASQFRRCLAKSDGLSDEITIAYLDDSNSNYYEDGSEAALDGSQGDVMVYFPEYWYKYENVDDDYFRYYFFRNEIEDGVHVPASLVGAYKAYADNEKLYSLSGVTPTVSISKESCATYAATRGEGYQIIDYQHHCIIAQMLYAKYCTTFIKDILGDGVTFYTITTGATNSLGNNDSVDESDSYVNGLGIEGVYGGIGEWVDGVTIDGSDQWVIDDIYGSRTIPSVYDSYTNGYIVEIAAEYASTYGGYYDMTPLSISSSSGMTIYESYYRQADASSGNVMVRANSGNMKSVAVAGFDYGSSYTHLYYGSRLAFRGTITQAASAEEFKSMAFNK